MGNQFFIDMTDEYGHQLPNFRYPGLSRKEIVEAVENFYGRCYFRPRVIFRILRRAIFDTGNAGGYSQKQKSFLSFVEREEILSTLRRDQD